MSGRRIARSSRDGRKRLHAEVIRCGGAARWALELGVPRMVHPRRAGLGDEEIAAALRRLLREHRPERFPGVDVAGTPWAAGLGRRGSAHRRRRALGTGAQDAGAAAGALDR